MNTALWPSTLGYFMDTLLQPVFNDDDIYYTRWFLTASSADAARSCDPHRSPTLWHPASLRDQQDPVDIRQREAILCRLLTPVSRTARHGFSAMAVKVQSVLDQLGNIWRNLAGQVARVGADSVTGDTDPHQALLDIVGLHPASVEFHQRYASTQNRNTTLPQCGNCSFPGRRCPPMSFTMSVYAASATRVYRTGDAKAVRPVLEGFPEPAQWPYHPGGATIGG